jgi:hypothetical protein
MHAHRIRALVLAGLVRIRETEAEDHPPEDILRQMIRPPRPVVVLEHHPIRPRREQRIEPPLHLRPRRIRAHRLHDLVHPAARGEIDLDLLGGEGEGGEEEGGGAGHGDLDELEMMELGVYRVVERRVPFYWECWVDEKDEDKDREIAELERKLADRERKIRQLLKRIERLERKNEALSREARRQAVPFRQGKLKADPAKRGRRPGRRYGSAHREPHRRRSTGRCAFARRVLSSVR